jgi:hypothetical protein
MPGKKPKGLADPAQLAPFDKDDSDLIVVVIETPKGSRNKYAVVLAVKGPDAALKAVKQAMKAARR